MSGFFFRPGYYYDPSLLAGIDPATGLIPFDPPAAPTPGPQFDPNALLAALGPPPPGMPTDPHALMALLQQAARSRQPTTAVQPDFLQTIQQMLKGAPLPGATDPRAPPWGGVGLLADQLGSFDSQFGSGISSDAGGGLGFDPATAATAQLAQPDSEADVNGGQASTTQRYHIVSFDGRTVTLSDRDGKVLGTYPATSGLEGVTDPREPWRGPIPEGDYTLDPKEISEVHGLDYLLRRATGDWGNFRVPLRPAPGTETYGRTRFFLHGGDTSGSAGCIDVGGQDKVLFPLLRKLDGPVRLRVEYPKQK
jgi:hypothetical protein